MTDSAVLDTVLGLVFLFYALALLCSGLVEMIANWVKKRAKYLQSGIQDLLGGVVTVDVPVSERRRLEEMPATARTVLLNGMVERRRYDAMLHGPVPAPPREPAAAVPSETGIGLPTEQPMLRDMITLADVMGHPLVQPFRHATSLGKPTRNPSYLPSSVVSRTIVDLLTPGSTEPTLEDIDAGVRALDKSPKLRQSLSSILKAASGEFDSFMDSLQAWYDRQMDRVTGSYKRWAKRWVIILAIVVVCATNLDSIAIARALYASGAVRTAVVQQASQSFCSTPADPTKCAQQATDFLEKTTVPLGCRHPIPMMGSGAGR